MKKNLLLFLTASFIFSGLFAQGPTLNSENTTPNVGEGFVIQSATAASAADKEGGANETWDYSNLQDSGLAIAFIGVTPLSTPYSSSFPGSNFALKTIDNSAFQYFNAQTSSFNKLGDAIAEGKIIYTKPQVYVPYPFSYNSLFSDSVVRMTEPVNIIGRGKDSLSGDGYGTLKIPGKIYSNVLRIKYIENITSSYDTIITQGGISFTGTFIVNTRAVNYDYITPDTHSYLLSVSTIQTNSSIIVSGLPVFQNTNYIKTASYLKNFLLPVTFTSFNASLVNNNVNLKWQTGQETNTNKFNVQRSLTATGFTDIAELAATGKPTGSNYNYIDADFAKSGVPPTVYYRIKETDKDGKTFYSTTNVIHGNTLSASIYPNPAKNYINIKLKNATTADAVLIYDSKGHLVKQWNNYQISQPVNISNLNSGTYFISIKIKDNTSTTTLIKE